MEDLPRSRDDTLSAYIQLVRQDSPAAAAVIEQIQLLFGAHAAFRAALILVLLKNEVQPYHALPDIGMYTYLLKDTAEAIPLLEEAITYCLADWGIPQGDKSSWGKWQRILQAQSSSFQDPFEALLQRLRQISPQTALKLERIYHDYGYTTGSYGATALIWLEARVNKFGAGMLMELSAESIRQFTFWEYMHDRPEALNQFADLLETYRLEQQPENTAGAHDTLRGTDN
jgi:hypothetical protein